MSNYASNAILLLLIAFFLGCVVGCWLWSVMRRKQPAETRADEGAPSEESGDEPATSPALSSRALAERKTTMPTVQPESEAAVEASAPEAAAPVPSLSEETPPAAGAPDDLKRIKGVGPVIEKKLHAMGVQRFEQIAGWTRADIEEVDQKLNFRGRIDRDDWISQAKALAAE